LKAIELLNSFRNKPFKLIPYTHKKLILKEEILHNKIITTNKSLANAAAIAIEKAQKNIDNLKVNT